MPASLHCIRVLLIALAAGGLAAQKSPEEALRALTEGNRRFSADRSVPQPVGEGVRRTLARGQSPFAVVLSCSDSRVPPEHVFNCGLGDLVVVRVAGNTCEQETLASIEHAVEHLGASLVVVLGHEGCDAVATTVAQVAAQDGSGAEPVPSRAIQQLVERIEPAVRKARSRELGGKQLHDACEEENVHQTLHECLRRSPLLRRYVQIGRLQVVPARYHLDSGEVEWLPVRPPPAEVRHDADHSVDATPPAAPPHVALRMLQAGHRRFLGDGLPAGDLTGARREALTHGQNPLAIVLTCADSRVAPELVFDAGLGELTVVRVAGNIVNDDVLASVERAALHDGAALLIVMGHTRCGALAAAAAGPEGQQLSPSMRALLGRLEPSVERARRGARSTDELVELAARANVLRTVTELQTRSAILRDLEQRGRFAILPTVYDVATGDLTWLKESAEAEAAPPAAMPPAAPVGETAAQQQPYPAPPAYDRTAGDAGSRGAHDAPHHQLAPAPVVPPGPEAAPATAPPHDGPGHAPMPRPAAGAGAGWADRAADGHAARLPVATAGATDDGAAGPKPWPDPIPWVGVAGVASLLLAAVIALFSR